ncbi:fatty acid desaturase [bacterium (Candidatus Blackallbacteria) CG17_big_fil_post_rev_8_21_14_2_50_48_46]|uniref:Fatty acid desaturase n=1 Tax=bacterium (Candidatus Blackallbacteria) CG17_big_fil_post_rev_8_21_14_2_50_48_46 TaxID=2014261 RepID=A0A2M7G436_9BACT|nr:MAG: fatty acid desaturase [bacterium (Candidatus Blackallbacteria) CG18_big_fil_WC_8_21_14_2_50_49_26]PIW16587.1 MAG: fatty acid desaturase [bacterium (Candidatus Blackallbacteria) CG17_big_fil_post_rev_8_21_14_2_50_48_46]PIW46095.1 MAG: fatty acid desaturase [bacterium (Candidatus Blackallbacteria) CG13_big_fil_rev_8_21_14_2_50_49_14]
MSHETPDTLQNLDYAAFAAELEDLHQRLQAGVSEADFRHLTKIESWGQVCSLLGYATAWLLPNPISAYLISQGQMTRWANMTHHIRHRGYDRVPNIPKRYTSKGFARGWRRWVDWPDWLVPEAWDFEHNVLHHYHTGEKLDPDVLEDRAHLMRSLNFPLWMKYAVAIFFMLTWKLSYYAPNTLWMLQQRRSRPGRKGLEAKIAAHQPLIFHGAPLWWPFQRESLEFWARCVLPYALFRFALLPALFLPLGITATLNVLLTSILAELMTNLHSFLIIVPNHTGDDVYRFDEPVSDKAEFYVRQIIGSANFTGGTDFSDYLQGWLNYQIEHHLWPEMTMLQYQKAQPEVEALCKKYGVPYIRQSIWKRIGQTMRLLTGQSRNPFFKTRSRQERERDMVAV